MFNSCVTIGAEGCFARNRRGARTVASAGAEVQRGALEDLDGLRREAAAVDGVIHTALSDEFWRFRENCALHVFAIHALGEVLAGSDRPRSSPPASPSSRPVP